MGNHQNKKGSRKLFWKEYKLSDGQTLVLRNPELGDEQGLIDQLKTVDRETKFLARECDEFNFTLEQEREFIKNSTNDENLLFLIGEIDGKIIGNCSVGVISRNKRFLHRAAMGIAICKDYWNKGIGKRMMQKCIEWCEEKGVEQLELEVVAENKRAISLYENLGFQIFGTKKHALKYADGTYADEYFMVLFLNRETS